MGSLQKWGGVSALAIAASYVFGFALFIGVLDRTGYEGAGGELAFVADNVHLLSTAIIALYPLAACALCVLAIALRVRLDKQPIQRGWNDVAAVFGAIWAALLFASGFIGLVGMHSVTELAQTTPEVAQSTWSVVSIIQNALGGGIELVGGVWMALVSAIAMRVGFTGKALGFFGIAIGAVGIATVVPALSDLADIFGLGQIVWFAALGVALMRSAPTLRTDRDAYGARSPAD